MRDPYVWQRNHEVVVEVDVWGSHGQVAPLMDELGKHFGEIRTRQTFPAPGTGATTSGEWALVPDIVAWITIIGGAEVLRRILGSMTDDAYRGLRRKLLGYRKRRLAMRRIKRGVHIGVGAHRFVFEQSISDDEFKQQLVAAQRIVERSPAPLLASDFRDEEPALWLWDKAEARWRTSGVRLAAWLGEESIRLD